eukprot:g22045.t1
MALPPNRHRRDLHPEDTMTEWIAIGGRLELFLILLPALPLIGALVILSSLSSRMANAGRGIAIGVLLATLMCAALMLITPADIDLVTAAAVSTEWISFPEGPDGLSLAAELPRASIALLLFGSLVLSALVVVATIEPTANSSHVGLHCAGVLLALFGAAMVLFAADFLTLFVFWQFSGVLGAACMLRGNDDGRNAAVARKVFLYGLVSDVALLIGILLIWQIFGTVDIRAVIDRVSGPVALSTYKAESLSIACLFLLAGTAGRCWQFPLIDLVSDCQRLRGRRAGAVQQFLVMPTGVAVLLRCLPLFHSTDGSATWIVAVGFLSAFLAALCALTGRRETHVAEWLSVGLPGMMFVGIGTGATTGVMGAVSLFVVHQLLVPVLCGQTGRPSQRLRLLAVLLLFCGLGGQFRILAAVLPEQSGSIRFSGYLFSGLVGVIQFLFAMALVRRLPEPDRDAIPQEHGRRELALSAFASIMATTVAALFVVAAVLPLHFAGERFAPSIRVIIESRTAEIDWGTDWMVALITFLPAAMGAIIGWRLGSMLVFFGIVALVMAHSWNAEATPGGDRELTFSIARLTSATQEAKVSEELGGEHWRMMQSLIVLPLMFGLAIKASIFPLHRWLPTAQTESPTVVGIVLCGVSVNLGIYGCVRFLLPALQESGETGAGGMATWALVSTVIAGLLALAQGDFRRMVAYAVVGHAGLCIAAVFSMNVAGMAGGLLRALSQGLCLGGLAFLLGGIRRRYDTFEIKAFGGLMRRYPRLGSLFALMILATVAVPGTGGFAATLAAVSGIFHGSSSDSPNLVGTAAALCGLVLVAAAMIWMMQRVVFGPFREPVIDDTSFAAGALSMTSQRIDVQQRDLTGAECATLLPLIAVVLWIGLMPQFFLDRITPSVRRFQPDVAQADAETGKRPGSATYDPDGDADSIGRNLNSRRKLELAIDSTSDSRTEP